MTSADLDHAVAWATGESVATIKRLGFLLADPDAEIHDPDSVDHSLYIIDWDVPDETRSRPPIPEICHAPTCS